ncbi:hypothetical protein HELRODRAFT_166395 [Helobdella robusta]|uniref:Uncharacterized protein n=1 Tax=Helobdella robusta TaxID=6412 RepID=T1EY32_HELRO|nr:hypothetical protein HELRODRAFT_166395 [Helobdella robusta]ESN90691.1 hypothetical protein HELRODRAFT_166395 [Helobdella robusta]
MLGRSGLMLQFLPFRSPILNPIEEVFSKMEECSRSTKLDQRVGVLYDQSFWNLASKSHLMTVETIAYSRMRNFLGKACAERFEFGKTRISPIQFVILLVNDRVNE